MDLVHGKQFIDSPCVREHSWNIPCTYSVFVFTVLSSVNVAVVVMSLNWSHDRHMSRTRHNTRRHVAATAHVVMKLNTKHERHFLLINIIIIIVAVLCIFVDVVTSAVEKSLTFLYNLKES